MLLFLRAGRFAFWQHHRAVGAEQRVVELDEVDFGPARVIGPKLHCLDDALPPLRIFGAARLGVLARRRRCDAELFVEEVQQAGAQ